MATVISRIGVRWEASYPVAIGVAGAVIALAFAPKLLGSIKVNEWDVGVVYSSIFDVAAVTTAFSFTFYAFILTAESGFIGRMKRSIYYKNLLRFTITATALGSIVVLTSIPMMVVKPVPVGSWTLSAIFVALWFGLVAATAASFFRAARLFAIFAAQHH